MEVNSYKSTHEIANLKLINFLFFVANIQAPINVPRMVNSTQIRASSGAAIIQQHPANVQIQSHPPALHPVSQNTFAPGGAQVNHFNFNLEC